MRCAAPPPATSLQEIKTVKAPKQSRGEAHHRSQKFHEDSPRRKRELEPHLKLTAKRSQDRNCRNKMTVASLDAKNAINPENLNATTVTHVSGVRTVPESRDEASESEARNNMKREARFSNWNFDLGKCECKSKRKLKTAGGSPTRHICISLRQNLVPRPYRF